ncbi:hypothetical protein Bca4012_037597 [Brassica carinata]
MSGNMKEKVAVCVNDGKTTPAATVPTANAYANATVLEQIKNLAAAFRHRKSTKTSSQFLYLNRKGNDKIYQTPKIHLVTKLEKSQRTRSTANRFTDSHCHTSYKQLSRNKRENERRSELNLTRTTCHRVKMAFVSSQSEFPLRFYEENKVTVPATSPWARTNITEVTSPSDMATSPQGELTFVIL